MCNLACSAVDMPSPPVYRCMCGVRNAVCHIPHTVCGIERLESHANSINRCTDRCSEAMAYLRHAVTPDPTFLLSLYRSAHQEREPRPEQYPL